MGMRHFSVGCHHSGLVLVLCGNKTSQLYYKLASFHFRPLQDHVLKSYVTSYVTSLPVRDPPPLGQTRRIPLACH